MDWISKIQWTLISCPIGHQRSGYTSRRGGQSRISPQTNYQIMHHGYSRCPPSRSSIAKCHVSGDWNNLPLGGHLSWKLPRTVAVLESFSTESNHEWISWMVSLPLGHHGHVQPKSLVPTWTQNVHHQWPNCWSPRIKMPDILHYKKHLKVVGTGWRAVSCLNVIMFKWFLSFLQHCSNQQFWSGFKCCKMFENFIS